MKKTLIRKTVLLFLAGFFLFTQVLFAEEDKGAIKGAWRRFLERFEKEKVSEEQDVSPPVPEKVVLPVPQKVVLPEPELAEPAGLEEEERPVEKLTDEELRERLKRMVEEEEDVLEYMPELRVEFGEDGYITTMEYSIDGVFRNIEELNRMALMRIFNRISNTRIRVIQERLENIHRIVSPPQAVTGPPKVPTAPTVPRVPTTPSAPPRAPASPPRAPTPPTRR